MGILNWSGQRSDMPSAKEMNRALTQLVPLVPVLSEDEVAEIWVRDGYGTLVRARHIVFLVTRETTSAERERLRLRAESIRARVADGEDFVALACEYSMEPGSRSRGGDLGFFGRDRMVEAFEQAAFALGPGQVSDVVETPFGYHLIRVEERREEEMHNAAMFRKFLLDRAQRAAVFRYIQQVRRTARVEVETDAARRLRELARCPKMPRGFAAKRTLVSYRGGKLTVAHMVGILQEPRNAQHLAQIAAASDLALRGFLADQAIRRLIWDAANRSKSHTQARHWQRTGSRSSRVVSAPGAGLLWFADFFYSRKDADEALKPVVEDMRLEYFDACANGRVAKANWIRVRGTSAFVYAACRVTPLGKVVASVWGIFS